MYTLFSRYTLISKYKHIPFPPHTHTLHTLIISSFYYHSSVYQFLHSSSLHSGVQNAFSPIKPTLPFPIHARKNPLLSQHGRCFRISASSHSYSKRYITLQQLHLPSSLSIIFSQQGRQFKVNKQ